jgi:hypothetical protein
MLTLKIQDCCAEDVNKAMMATDLCQSQALRSGTRYFGGSCKQQALLVKRPWKGQGMHAMATRFRDGCARLPEVMAAMCLFKTSPHRFKDRLGNVGGVVHV